MHDTNREHCLRYGAAPVGRRRRVARRYVAPGGEALTLALATARTHELDEATRSAVVRVCTEAHDEPDFEHLFSYLPPDGLHVLATIRGDLVGHAVVTTRWLQPAGLPLLRTAYVDAVSTSPAHQARGVGSAVMRALIAAAIEDGYVVACLETDATGFYERLGWREWRGPLAGRSDDGLIPTPDQRGVMVLRLPKAPPLDFATSLTIEASRPGIW